MSAKTVFWVGRARFSVNAETPDLHASIAKCSGKPVRPRSGEERISTRQHPGVTYRHADGWRIFVPFGMIRDESRRGADGMPMTARPGGSGHCRITIGQYTLTLRHEHRTVSGYIPESWRVDLNAGPITPDCEVLEFPQPELLAA
jgi:hypothetical protein